MRDKIPTGLIVLLVLLARLTSPATADDAEWREGAPILTPRTNPFHLDPDHYTRAVEAGRGLALQYPVSVSGVLIPWRPFKTVFESTPENPLRAFLKNLFEGIENIHSVDDAWKRLGLNDYPDATDVGIYHIPRPPNEAGQQRMGVSILSFHGVEAISLSCAACHSASLFGKKILGLTNRFPAMNRVFVDAKRAVGLIDPVLFQVGLKATPEESAVYTRLRERLSATGGVTPLVRGLDTSLAGVALSLARRSPDEYATFDPVRARHPREEILQSVPADSKPAVWWNVKYKNRWLLDGSVVSGNPIYTNLLWNELSRGTDLHELKEWIETHPDEITALTTAVFSTEPPLYTDFFPAESIRESEALHGEKLFAKNCAKCHGNYVKAWSDPARTLRPWSERLQTIRVDYPKTTRVINVGTDSSRREGMVSLAAGLNPLAISREWGIRVAPQPGYVPPPLVGIWARWPYFHNNSAPSLCAVLTPAAERPKKYLAVEAVDPARDFDSECNGYPLADEGTEEWTRGGSRIYDTSREGMHNSGHDVGILSREDRRDLIQYLKTL